jgi:hypothetical protein
MNGEMLLFSLLFEHYIESAVLVDREEEDEEDISNSSVRHKILDKYNITRNNDDVQLVKEVETVIGGNKKDILRELESILIRRKINRLGI